MVERMGLTNLPYLLASVSSPVNCSLGTIQFGTSFIFFSDTYTKFRIDIVYVLKLRLRFSHDHLCEPSNDALVNFVYNVL